MIEVDELFVAKEDEISSKDYVVAEYYIESKLPLLKAGIEIAKEESIGTWTKIYTLTESAKRLAGKVFKVDEETRKVWIAFPVELFDIEYGGASNILSIVAGNLFGLSKLENVRLLDIHIPEKICKKFPGPKFGIENIRKLIGTNRERRPHIGTIIKPKVGLNPDETAKVAYEVAIGGIDFIKDDETLVNQKFCPLNERVSKVMEALDKAKEETGRQVLYAVNVSASTPYTLIELVDQALENGANMLMIDAVVTGIPMLQMLAEDPMIKVPIHVHRAMHAAFTRNKRHGIRMVVLAKLIRLAGGDQLHVGTAGIGKMEADVRETLDARDALLKDIDGIEKTFPVASGGLHPGLIPSLLKAFGVDAVFQFGGGCHGHPDGPRAGAMAIRQAIEACMKGVSLKEYAKTHPELRKALETWPS